MRDIIFSKQPDTAITRELFRVLDTNAFTMTAELRRISFSSLWCHASISTNLSIAPGTRSTRSVLNNSSRRTATILDDWNTHLESFKHLTESNAVVTIARIGAHLVWCQCGVECPHGKRGISLQMFWEFLSLPELPSRRYFARGPCYMIPDPSPTLWKYLLPSFLNTPNIHNNNKNTLSSCKAIFLFFSTPLQWLNSQGGSYLIEEWYYCIDAFALELSSLVYFYEQPLEADLILPIHLLDQKDEGLDQRHRIKSI